MSPDPNPLGMTLSSTLSDDRMPNENMSLAFVSQPQAAHVSPSLRVRRATISATAVETCRRYFRNTLHAVILTGSLARDEATFLEVHAKGTCVLGDAEFVLIFNQDTVLPARQIIFQVQTEIEEKLRAGDLFCTIGLSAAHPSYLRNLRPHIYAYELRNCGRVAWGGPRVLSLIPNFLPCEIPLEDGWRMLSNRMIEHLAVADAALDPDQSLSPEVLYSTVKLSLDMATSFLLFCGLYAPTYQKRCDRLRTLAKAGAAKFDPPFSLQDFAELVDWATHCKLSPNFPLVSADRKVWITAVTFAASLWQWELTRLAGLHAHTDSRQLMDRWMSRQSFHTRFRGWASLLRRSGWKQNASYWHRWARLAWQASPRYWIYAAASQLFFALPAIAEPNGQDARLRKLLGETIPRSLPIVQATKGNHSPDWRDLASDILWNYREFLKETCS